MRTSIEHSFTVPADRPYLPSIYTADKELMPRDQTGGFSIWVPFDKVDHLRSEKHGYRPFTRVVSRLRPTVIPGWKNVDRLVKELARLDAQNISRDHIFDCEPLLVTVAQWEYDHRGETGTAISLVSVEFYRGA